jgi:hypothetical protein
MLPNETRDIFWISRDYQMYHTRWINIDLIPWSPNSPGILDALGGDWTSPPAAVVSGPNRLDIFALGTDYSLYHRVYNPTVGQFSPGWESLGGNFTSMPAVVSTAENTVDLFGLGPDQSLLHISWNGSAWGTWDVLGGGFTTLPVIVPDQKGGFDIFARGLDFLIYHAHWKPKSMAEWHDLGGGLLGAPAAASAPAVVRVKDHLFVFVTASDATVWYTIYDGEVWRPWGSIGLGPNDPTSNAAVSFISEPLAFGFSWQSIVVEPPPGGGVIGNPTSAIAPPTPVVPDGMRVDVFGVGSDFALWHRWLDSQGWHGATDSQGHETGQWESLGGTFACAPSIVATSESHLNPIEAGIEIQFHIAVPNRDGTIHLMSYVDNAWSGWDQGPAYELPSLYTVAIESMTVHTTRSLFNDTDYGSATLGIGRWPIASATENIGNVGTGGYEIYNLDFGPSIVELCEPLAFTYSIVNSGNSSGAASILSALITAGVQATGDFLKSQISPPSQVQAYTVPSPGSLSDGLTTTVVSGLGGGLLAGIPGAALTYLVNQLLGIVFADCDGVVATGVKGYQKGRDLETILQSLPTHTLEISTLHPGTTSPSGCGANSSYTVTCAFSRASVANL